MTDKISLIQLRNHFYLVTYVYIYIYIYIFHVLIWQCISSKQNMELFFLVASSCLPWVILNFTIILLNLSFYFRFAYYQVFLDFILYQNKHQDTCCAQMFSVVVHVSVSLSLSLSPLLPFPVLPPAFSHPYLLLSCLSLTFLRSLSLSVPSSSFSFFPRHLFSSFSHLPRATERPSSATCLRCMFSWWYESLKRRTLLLRSDTVSSLHQCRIPCILVSS